jgi:F0F1-type ATP synthase membrane subunit b/b'
MLNVEDSFARLQLEFTQKQAEIKALGVQQKASAQRLEDFLKREGEAKAAWQQASAALDQANKELSQARRDATKIRADAKGERDRILQEAHVEAEGFLQGIRSAIAAAASVIKRHKQEND